MRKKLYPIILLLLNFSIVKAETGCLVNNDTQLYPNDLGIKNPYNQGNPQTRGYNGVPITYVNNNGNSQPCGVIAKSDLVKTSTACYLYSADGNTFLGNGSYAYTTSGYKPCLTPLDDYIPVLILAMTCLAFYQINKRKTNILPSNNL
ncbi:hypothetical protein [Pedobacter frigiditerrae]|uniref:hypothetical protein n=1 Tax=Pedobacter frigiditerrae TaxID=2530452 RepID=UPI002931F256|nr:hypothetical protein [Pedobacter frigiditerrae]